MSLGTPAPADARRGPGPGRGSPRTGLVVAVVGLGLALAANALLGPLGAGVIDYRYGTSMTNQGIGLDAVALVAAAPLALVAAGLIRRGRTLGPVLAFAPASFAAYMAPQYLIGPDYLGRPGNNEDFALGHIGLFVLSVGVLVGAWRAIDPARLHPSSSAKNRSRAWILVGLAAFIALGRQLPAVLAVMADASGTEAYRDNPTAFWLVVFLDLGVITPAALATAWGLVRGAAWARTAEYVVIGWFLLVPASVAAMSVAMWANDDPLATFRDTVVFAVAAVVLTAAALLLYRPVLAGDRSAEGPTTSGMQSRPR